MDWKPGFACRCHGEIARAHGQPAGSNHGKPAGGRIRRHRGGYLAAGIERKGGIGAVEPHHGSPGKVCSLDDHTAAHIAAGG